MNFLDPRLPDRFWERCIPEPNSGCWLWIGPDTGQRGWEYGSFYAHDRKKLAHRVSYAALVGPIEPGLVIDHLCRTPLCVNPVHLEPVTDAENKLRGLKSGKVPLCGRGHQFTDDNTRMAVSDGRRYRKCVTCERETLAVYKETHREKIRAYQREWLRRKKARSAA